MLRRWHYFYSFNDRVIFLYVYVPHFLTHLLVDRHLAYFHVLSIVNSDALNIGVYEYLGAKFFSGYMPKFLCFFLMGLDRVEGSQDEV